LWGTEIVLVFNTANTKTKPTNSTKNNDNIDPKQLIRRIIQESLKIT
jgi:hypothetical protein